MKVVNILEISTILKVSRKLYIRLLDLGLFVEVCLSRAAFSGCV